MALLRSGRAAALGAAALLLGAPVGVDGQHLTQDEALGLAFPGADVERETAFLDDDQLAAIGELAGSDARPAATIVTYYVARNGGRPVGVAYFDAHTVRTVDEVLMIVVGVDGRVARVETVSFREPPEYEAPEGWLRLFDGRPLDGELRTRRAIPNVTGATLTSQAVTRAVRRTLASHRVIDPFGVG